MQLSNNSWTSKLLLLLLILTMVSCQTEEEAWIKAQNTNTVEEYAKFINKYPESSKVTEAKARYKDFKVIMLFEAVKKGDLISVQQTKDDGIDLTTIDSLGMTLLHYAAHGCHAELVEYLLSQEMLINARGGDDATPLHWASRNGCTEVANILIKNGADLSAMIGYGTESIRIDADGNRIHSRTYNPTIKGTPLHWAAIHNQIEVVELLLNSGSDVNAKTRYGGTPLHFAAESGNVDLMKLLLESDALIHPTDVRFGYPIHYSSTPKMAKAFLDLGESYTTESDRRGLPIHTAAFLGFKDVVEFYLDEGIEIEALGDWNINGGRTSKVTPAWAAAYGGNLEIIQILKERGAHLDFSVTSYNGGGGLLHAAAWKGHTDVVNYLVDQGLNVNSRANIPTAITLASPWIGITPIGVASYYGHTEIVEILIKNGSNLRAICSGNWSLLDLAQQYDNLDIIKLLTLAL